MEANDLKALIEQLQGARVHTFFNEKALATLPDGFTTEDVSKYLPPPQRTIQNIHHLTERSFVDYWDVYADTDSALFVDERTSTFVAVFDYHPSTKQHGKKDHVAIYSCPKSVHWEAWAAFNGKLMPQDEFAKMIEERLPDIVDSAKLLELALTLQVKKGVSYASTVRLQSGEHSFSYDETIKGTTSAGTIKIPDEFVIAIPVYRGGQVIKIPAKLRFRLHETKLLIGYEILRTQLILQAETDKVTERVRKAVGEAQFYVAVNPA